jgi:membrane associated rhomboid family serine protease
VLAAGAGANVLAAAAQGGDHVAVGASTATFAALGILSAFRLRSTPSTERMRAKRWTVAVATVLLLAMLGTSRGADVAAHALGLLGGVAVGLVVAPCRSVPARTIQWALVAAAAAAIVGCWRLALSGAAG